MDNVIAMYYNLIMAKINKSMRFDEDTWNLAEQAGKQTNRSTTEYVEWSVNQQVKRDVEDGLVNIPKGK
jgi:hypothetical protein